MSSWPFATGRGLPEACSSAIRASCHYSVPVAGCAGRVRSKPQFKRIDVKRPRECGDGVEDRTRHRTPLEFRDGILRDAAEPFELFLRQVATLPQGLEIKAFHNQDDKIPD